MSSPASFLRGNLIYLRSLGAEDFGDTMVRWLSDREVTRHLFRGTFPPSVEELKEEFRTQSGTRTDLQLAVMENQTDAYIGVAGLHSISWVSRHAEFRVLLGEKDAWGKGYGTEVAQLLVAYGIKVLNLNKIWLGVTASNTRAVESYRKTGFVEEGILREEIFRNGKYHPVLRMSILQPEYESLSKQWPIAKLLKDQLPE